MSKYSFVVSNFEKIMRYSNQDDVLKTGIQVTYKELLSIFIYLNPFFDTRTENFRS